MLECTRLRKYRKEELLGWESAAGRVNPTNISESTERQMRDPQQQAERGGRAMQVGNKHKGAVVILA